MPRLRNTDSGAIVSVPDEKAKRLGPEWVPVAEPKKATAKKAASSGSTK